jgi:hypothetical protein
MDDGAQRRSRLRGWAQLMQEAGIPVPPRIARGAQPRSGLGSFGGYATRRASQPPPPRPGPASLKTPQPPGEPRWRGYGIDGPDARPAPQPTRQRAFPVRNAPWGS